MRYTIILCRNESGPPDESTILINEPFHNRVSMPGISNNADVKNKVNKDKIHRQNDYGTALSLKRTSAAVDGESSCRESVETTSKKAKVCDGAGGENKTMTTNEFHSLHELLVSGQNETRSEPYCCPAPILSFRASPFNERVVKRLEREGFTAPTPIQSQAWPIVMEGRDIISIARTGSGKTIGFLLPVFEQVLRLQKHCPPNPAMPSPLAVVLAPTRELAMQIGAEAIKFNNCYDGGVRTVCLFGGASKWEQIRALKTRLPQVVVATPGRLNDLSDMGRISLSNVAIFVLDEADRMLDMGFGPQLEELQRKMRKQLSAAERPACGEFEKRDARSRQTLLFSATWPKSVQKVADSMLFNPVQLNVGSKNVLVANENINQRVLVVDGREKMDILQRELDLIDEGAKVIVFFNTKSMCNRAANQLWDAGRNCDALHGDKEQWERTRIMKEFSKGNVPLLFATDVAARGLDVKDIQFVINFDFPRPKGAAGIEDFVHRIGRTGRAGATGTAVTLFTRDDATHARSLVQLLKRAKQNVPQELEAMVLQQQSFMRNNRSNNGRGGRGRRHGGNGGGGSGAAWRNGRGRGRGRR